MIEMHVKGIFVDESSGTPIVILNDAAKELALPIWIGLSEARAISLAVYKLATARPLTHDLYLSTITRLGYELREVLIDELDSETYKATLVLTPTNSLDEKETVELDARPSDAIAVATVAGARLLVSSAILARLGIPQENLRVQIRDERQTRRAVNQVEDEEFKSFLHKLKASDFKLPSTSSENGTAEPESDSNTDFGDDSSSSQ